MSKYHPDQELAPRDIVARAILAEMIDLKDDCVYLDITNKDTDWIKERFPTIYEYCLEVEKSDGDLEGICGQNN